MAIDIELILSLIREVKEATNLKIILSPRESLPLRASLSGDAGKKVKVEYSPSRCDTGDLAFELLRGAFIAQGERNGSLLRTSQKAGSNDYLTVSWINTLLSVRWVMRELKNKGLKVEGLLRDYFENSLIYLEMEDGAYSHIADPDRRRIYSAVNFAMYLLTKGDVDYAETGSRLEALYRSVDPEGADTGSRAAAIIDSEPLSWEGIRGVAEKLMELFNLDRDRIEVG
ncbi:MAG: hypothetical protein ACP5K1_05875 [Candidatus Bathyarchaeia archaeon]